MMHLVQKYTELNKKIFMRMNKFTYCNERNQKKYIPLKYFSHASKNASIF